MDNVSSVTARFGLINGEAYGGARSLGMPPADAAWQTPFGKSMQKLGFQSVEQNGSDIFKFTF